MDVNRYDETVSTSRQESLLKALEIFYDSENESKKEIVRPDINVAACFAKVILFALCCMLGAASAVIVYIFTDSLLFAAACILLTIIFILFTLKKIIITMILLYQKLAPERIRLSCVFEPSCSEYMLLAINKYGVFKGVFLGIKRLLRCHQPNGGTDYP